MRRILWISIVLFVALGIYLGIVPNYRFNYYYYKKDSTKVLTRVTYPNQFFRLNDTYLVPGFYDKRQIPETYVKPSRSSDGDWYETVTFHSKGILIIGFMAETKRLNDVFRYYTNTVTYYADARKLDSIEASLKDTQKIALYSYDE